MHHARVEGEFELPQLLDHIERSPVSVSAFSLIQMCCKPEAPNNGGTATNEKSTPPASPGKHQNRFLKDSNNISNNNSSTGGSGKRLTMSPLHGSPKRPVRKRTATRDVLQNVNAGKISFGNANSCAQGNRPTTRQDAEQNLLKTQEERTVKRINSLHEKFNDFDWAKSPVIYVKAKRCESPAPATNSMVSEKEMGEKEGSRHESKSSSVISFTPSNSSEAKQQQQCQKKSRSSQSEHLSCTGRPEHRREQKSNTRDGEEMEGMEPRKRSTTHVFTMITEDVRRSSLMSSQQHGSTTVYSNRENYDFHRSKSNCSDQDLSESTAVTFFDEYNQSSHRRIRNSSPSPSSTRKEKNEFERNDAGSSTSNMRHNIDSDTGHRRSKSPSKRSTRKDLGLDGFMRSSTRSMRTTRTSVSPKRSTPKTTRSSVSPHRSTPDNRTRKSGRQGNTKNSKHAEDREASCCEDNNVVADNEKHKRHYTKISSRSEAKSPSRHRNSDSATQSPSRHRSSHSSTQSPSRHRSSHSSTQSSSRHRNSHSATQSPSRHRNSLSATQSPSRHRISQSATQTQLPVARAPTVVNLSETKGDKPSSCRRSKSCHRRSTIENDCEEESKLRRSSSQKQLGTKQKEDSTCNGPSRDTVLTEQITRKVADLYISASLKEAENIVEGLKAAGRDRSPQVAAAEVLAHLVDVQSRSAMLVSGAPTSIKSSSKEELLKSDSVTFTSSSFASTKGRDKKWKSTRTLACVESIVGELAEIASDSDADDDSDCSYVSTPVTLIQESSQDNHQVEVSEIPNQIETGKLDTFDGPTELGNNDFNEKVGKVDDAPELGKIECNEKLEKYDEFHEPEKDDFDITSEEKQNACSRPRPPLWKSMSSQMKFSSFRFSSATFSTIDEDEFQVCSNNKEITGNTKKRRKRKSVRENQRDQVLKQHLTGRAVNRFLGPFQENKRSLRSGGWRDRLSRHTNSV